MTTSLPSEPDAISTGRPTTSINPRFELLAGLTDAGRPSNEDALGATPTAAWVIDGAKGPFDDVLTPGPTDATWHAQALSAILFERFAAPPLDPSVALAGTAESLAAAYAREAATAAAHEQPSACLALAALSAPGRLHLFNIGDCRILVEKDGVVRSFGTSGIEPLERAAIAEVDRLRRTMGDDFDPWPRLSEILRRNFEIAMNRPGGYWVVHPSLPWLEAVQHEELSADQVDHILLASDGFFRLVNVFSAYDMAGLLAAARRTGGLRALFSELRRLEAADPACRRYPRLKSMDDASAVLIRIRS